MIQEAHDRPEAPAQAERGWAIRLRLQLEGQKRDLALFNLAMDSKHGWVESAGLDRSAYGTHSMCRTKAAQINRKTGNLRAVQLLLGHTKLESKVPNRAATRVNRRRIVIPSSRRSARPRAKQKQEAGRLTGRALGVQ